MHRLIVTSVAIAALAGLPAAAQDTGQAGDAAGATVPAAGAILEVTAQGRSTRIPDIATIRAGVVAQAPSAATALADNAARMSRVVAALRKAGVAARDVQTASVSLNPQYRYADGQPPAITGYQASNSVAIRFRAIDRAGAILDALVREGANQIEGPALSIDQPDAALDEARRDAVARARARADLYARAAGMRVDRIVRIAEAGESGGDQPVQPMMFVRAAVAAPTPIVAGERDLTATVMVRFLLR